MPTTSAVTVTITDRTILDQVSLTFRRPALDDGARMWQLAKSTGVLDLNSSYAYLMWCHDFADTSVVAEADGEFAGFITGYIRPSAPNTLMIWQVATDSRFRGRGIASLMLAELFDRCQVLEGIDRLETTITADNPASIGLFTKFAQERRIPVVREPLFEEQSFPDEHDTEFLYQIGPQN